MARGKKRRVTKQKGSPPTAIPKHLSHLPSNVQKTLAPLSILTRNFVMAYVGEARGNGTLAAKLAGIVSTSTSTLASRACIMLQDPLVRAAIDAWMQAFAMTASELTASITDLVAANMGPFIKWNADGSLEVKVPTDDDWEAHKHWIKELETDPKSGKVVRIQLHDSMGARRELAKILKLYSDQPIFQLHLHLQQMTDDQLLAELESARAEEGGGPGGRGLPPGGPISVTEPPGDGSGGGKK